MFDDYVVVERSVYRVPEQYALNHFTDVLDDKAQARWRADATGGQVNEVKWVEGLAYGIIVDLGLLLLQRDLTRVLSAEIPIKHAEFADDVERGQVHLYDAAGATGVTPEI